MCVPKQWLFKYFTAKGIWKWQYLFFCVSTTGYNRLGSGASSKRSHTLCLPGLVNMALLRKGSVEIQLIYRSGDATILCHSGGT